MKLYFVFAAAGTLYQILYLIRCVGLKRKRAAVGAAAGIAVSAAACIALLV